MPILDVKFSTPIERDLRSAIASTLSSITARVLRKKQELTAVVVDQVDPRSWFVGGPSLAEQHKASFFLDIRVVDGTNLKDEKADYLREISRRWRPSSVRSTPRATSTSTTSARTPTATAA